MKPHNFHAPGLNMPKLDGMIARRRARIDRELAKGGKR